MLAHLQIRKYSCSRAHKKEKKGCLKDEKNKRYWTVTEVFNMPAFFSQLFQINCNSCWKTTFYPNDSLNVLFITFWLFFVFLSRGFSQCFLYNLIVFFVFVFKQKMYLICISMQIFCWLSFCNFKETIFTLCSHQVLINST